MRILAQCLRWRTDDDFAKMTNAGTFYELIYDKLHNLPDEVSHHLPIAQLY
ncbi:MAG: hypothetical protein ACI81O_001167 [Cyclobacteriaceae bacterium]|jgi:hypothetical protein